MSIVHLSKRITKDIDKYNEYLRSSDSLIYLTEPWEMDESGPDCLSLTVGECWYDDARYLEIDSKRGIKIKPHDSAVIETAEEIALPFNMYGLLFGAGSNIYRGTFISSGKIDPGFYGRLRIGFHNGSNKPVVLKRGDKLAYGIFVSTECDLERLRFPHALSQPAVSVLSRKERFKRWFVQNVYQLLTISISIASLVVAICVAFNK